MEYTNLTLSLSYGKEDRLNTTINIKRDCCDINILEMKNDFLIPILLSAGYHLNTIKRIFVDDEDQRF